jgi:hypothetical protein
MGEVTAINEYLNKKLSQRMHDILGDDKLGCKTCNNLCSGSKYCLYFERELLKHFVICPGHQNFK